MGRRLTMVSVPVRSSIAATVSGLTGGKTDALGTVPTRARTAISSMPSPNSNSQTSLATAVQARLASFTERP